MEVQILVKAVVSITLFGILGGLVSRLSRELVGNPEKVRSALRIQGIGGPPPTLLLGNVLEIKKTRTTNCANALFPFIGPWHNKYGHVFVFSIGVIPILYVTQPDMVREITTCTSLDLGKPSYLAKDLACLLGRGILTSNGNQWAHQTKIIAPEFHLDKVKGMIKLIRESAMTLIDVWSNMIEAKGGVADIKIDQHLRSFSGDVISKACFGSDYSKGGEIFVKIRALLECASKKGFSFGIPYS